MSIVPTSGDDVLIGTTEPDVIDALAGNDQVFGDGGADDLRGGEGNDTIYGGDGNDWIEGGEGEDKLFGDAGDDTLTDIGADYTSVTEMHGGSGNDKLSASGPALMHTIHGDEGNDTITGYGTYYNTIFLYGDDGDDTIIGYLGSESTLGLDGGTGNDTLSIQRDSGAGGIRKVYLSGGDGDDTLDAGVSESFELDGGSGNDVLIGGLRQGSLSGGAGNDRLDASGSFEDVTINGGTDDDVLISGAGHDELFGGDGDDDLSGGINTDLLTGGAGNDTYRGYALKDTDNPATGTDVVFANSLNDDTITDYENGEKIDFGTSLTSIAQVQLAAVGANTELRADTNNDGSFETVLTLFGTVSGNIVLSSENGYNNNIVRIVAPSAIPTSGDDILVGTDKPDVIDSLGGNDVVYGNAGDDDLRGGTGSDIIHGGDGNDTIDGGEGDGLPYVSTRDELYGDAGDDTIVDTGDNGFFDEVRMFGGTGNDTLNAGQNAYIYLDGGSGNDVLIGGAGQGSMIGGEGDDFLNANSTFSYRYQGLSLDGGEGNDTLIAGQGYDVLTGGSGVDTFRGSVVYVYDPSIGSSVARGNTLYSAVITDYENGEKIDLGTNLDSVTRLQLVRTGSYTEVYIDTDKDGSFDTNFFNMEGNVDGSIVLSSENGLTNNILRIVAPGAVASGNDDILVGTDNSDGIDGLAGDDLIIGSAGNDDLQGGDGNDTLDGGVGTDTLTGGAGVDTYRGSATGYEYDFHTERYLATGTTLSGDIITDYQAGEKIDLGFSLFSTMQLIFSWNGTNTDLLVDPFRSGGFSTAVTFSGYVAGQITLSSENGLENNIIQISGSKTTKPVAIADKYELNEDQTLVVSAKDGVLSNDFDAEGDFLQSSLLDRPENGHVVLNADGSFSYTPNANFNGVDSFSYDVDDGSPLFSDIVTVTLNVRAVNDAPVAANDSGFTTSYNTPLTIAPALLLTNDTDGDPELVQTLSLSAVGSATNGVVVLVNGNVVFTPTNGYSGSASFEYTVSDGAGGTATASASLDVSAPPPTNTPTVGNDVLVGTDEPDTIDGLAGNDQVFGLAGRDTLIGNDGDDALYGNEDDDTLIGGSGADMLNGGSGNDMLSGGEGADTLVGGTGIDTANYAGSPDKLAVYVDLSRGIGLGGDAAGDRLSGIENVIGTVHADTLIGDSSANLLFGDGDNDVLEGRAGADVLDGGGNRDTASYASSQNGVRVDLGVGQGVGGDAEGDRWISIEDVVGSSFGDTLIGDAGNNILSGGDGNDVLNGGAGSNTLNGGAGDDIFEGSSGWDKIVGGSGNDTVTYARSATGVFAELSTGVGFSGDAAYDTFNGVENLLGSAFSDTLAGDDGANVLDGAAGNDTLVGGAGDTLIGGDGTDTASYTRSQAGVLVDLSSGLGFGGDGGSHTLVGIENLVGSRYADTLLGDAIGNMLDGSGGDDTLDGGAGADMLLGGAGSDTASYARSTDGVRVELSTGLGFEGDAEGDHLSGIENVIGSAYDDDLVGNTGYNRLDGGGGNDVLTGGAGNDTLIGGAGIDTASYAASRAGVQIDLLAGTAQGGDAGGDTLTSIENIVGSAFNDTLRGDANANALSGGAGNDTLSGGAGADTLIGGDGADTASYAASLTGVRIDLAAGTARGGDAGGDILFSIENLIGSSSSDILVGDGGSNVIDGGAGRDTLTGGSGADRFVFSTALNASTNVDAITDFDIASDTIQLSRSVFTALDRGGLRAADFTIGTAATNATQNIIYDRATGHLFYDADGTGSGAQTQFATLAAGLDLTNDDFFVV